MLRRRVAELYKPTTVHYTLRMDGWTLILGRPSRSKKIVLCIYLTRMRAGWRSHPRYVVRSLQNSIRTQVPIQTHERDAALWFWEAFA